MTVATQAGIDRKSAFADALKIRENWTQDQLEAEELRLAEEARVMVESGLVTILPPCKNNPDGIGRHALNAVRGLLSVGVL